MTKFNDVETERIILGYLFKDTVYIEEAVTKIAVSTFYDENHKKLFDLISRYFRKHHKVLSRDILERFLKKNEKEFPVDFQISLLLLYDDISKIQIDDSGFRFYLNELKELEIKRELYKTASDVIDDLGSDKEVEESLANVTERILHIKTLDSSEGVTRKLLYGNTDERWEAYLDRKNHPEKYRGIPYGMKDLDEVTGGLFPSKLGMVFGRMKRGKSRWLFNVGCNVSDLGYRVMYVTIEMELAILQLMWESRYTGITLNDLRDAKLTEYEEKIYQDALNQLKEKKCPFSVVDIARGTTPSMVDYEVMLHQKVFGIKPDVVIIDYANLMRPDERFVKDRSEKYDNVFRGLKEVARAHNVSILTAAQQNRKSIDVRREEVDTEHVALSDMAAAHCDVVFNIWHGMTPAEEFAMQLAKRVYLKIVASRYSESKTIELFADFSVNFIGDLEKLQEIWKKVRRNDQEF